MAVSSKLKQALKFSCGGNFSQLISTFNSDLRNVNYGQKSNVVQWQVVPELTCHVMKGFDPSVDIFMQR